MGGVTCSSVGVVNVPKGGEGGTSDLPSCIHYALQLDAALTDALVDGAHGGKDAGLSWPVLFVQERFLVMYTP